jgi:hypothetical protein
VQSLPGAEEQAAADRAADGDHLDLAITERLLISLVFEDSDISARSVLVRILCCGLV